MAKSFLFLPDISGFTKFVNDTEINHSQHIIAELLEILIDANDLDMQLAEIEGDALFFYMDQSVPSMEELSRQVEKMFLAFHNHLRLYDQQRICQCGACETAARLELKFFAHAGNIQFVEIRDFKKPHGREVIVVHRLMKNEVPLNEYLLVTNDLKEQMSDWDAAANHYDFKQLMESYDAGEIGFGFSNLAWLQDKLKTMPKYSGAAETNDPIVESAFIENSPDHVFELVSNFQHRHLWNDTKIIYKEDRVNRVGEEHICVINDRDILFETITKIGEEDQLIYGEKTGNIPLMKEVSSYYIVEKCDGGSLLKLEGHLQPKNVVGKFAKPFLKKKLRNNFQTALTKIKEAAENHSITDLVSVRA